MRENGLFTKEERVYVFSLSSWNHSLSDKALDPKSNNR